MDVNHLAAYAGIISCGILRGSLSPPGVR
jgi:hypothetical protein